MSLHTTTSPDDDRLAALIGEVFEALPAPDRWKLKQVEERLSRALTRKPQTRKPSIWAWWLVGALVMGSAAAWWVHERQQQALETETLNTVIEQLTPQETTAEPKPEMVEPKAPLNPSSANAKTQADTDASTKKRPTIYQRETY